MIKLELVPDSIEFLDMSDEKYFGEEYKNCISNSKLSLINPDQGGSKELYLQGFTGSTTPSLLLGSAVHSVVLQGNEFEINNEVVSRPPSKLGILADELYKVYKRKRIKNDFITDEEIIEAANKVDYYKNKMTRERIDNVLSKCQTYWDERYLHEIAVPKDLNKKQLFLDPKMLETANECITSLLSNRGIQTLLRPKGIFEDPIIVNEGALFFDVKATDTETGKSKILKIKGKLDNFTIDIDTNTITLNDLKTSSHILENFKASVKKWHYPRQFGLYAYMLKEYAKKYHNIDPDSFKVNLLVVSTVPPYASGIYKLKESEIIEGWKEFTSLLKLAAEVELEKDD